MSLCYQAGHGGMAVLLQAAERERSKRMHPLLEKQRELLNPKGNKESRREELLKLLIEGYEDLRQRIEKLENATKAD